MHHKTTRAHKQHTTKSTNNNMTNIKRQQSRKTTRNKHCANVAQTWRQQSHGQLGYTPAPKIRQEAAMVVKIVPCCCVLCFDKTIAFFASLQCTYFKQKTTTTDKVKEDHDWNKPTPTQPTNTQTIFKWDLEPSHF